MTLEFPGSSSADESVAFQINPVSAIVAEMTTGILRMIRP